MRIVQNYARTNSVVSRTSTSVDLASLRSIVQSLETRVVVLENLVQELDNAYYQRHLKDAQKRDELRKNDRIILNDMLFIENEVKKIKQNAC